MKVVLSPQQLTRAQRIAISVRGQSSVVATVKSKKSGNVSEKNVSWSLVVPLCESCKPHQRAVLGCQRFIPHSTPKRPHRIDYASDPSKAPHVSFCPRSYDDPSLDQEVIRVITEIDKEGTYPYFGKPIQLLPNRTYATIHEVRGAWARVHEERDAKEAEK